MTFLCDSQRCRRFIVATIFGAIVCNYLDRGLLSILKPEILTHFVAGHRVRLDGQVFPICYALRYPNNADDRQPAVGFLPQSDDVAR